MRRVTGLLLIAILVTACGDSTGSVEAKIPLELQGTWVANSTCSPTCSYTLTSISNPAAHADLVATAGLTVDLRLQADGGASLTSLGTATVGTARVSGNTLYLTSGGAVDTATYSVTATSLDLQFRSLLITDLNGDLKPDTTRAHAVLKKQ